LGRNEGVLQVAGCREVLQITGYRVQGDAAGYKLQGAREYIIHQKCLFCIFIEIFNHEKLP
jgi:hypothetical protein